MKICVLAAGCMWAVSLYGQSHFNWQNYCFDHPAAPVCPSHEFYGKRPAPAKPATSPTVVTNPFPSTPRSASPSLITVGGIDWRFADPFADALLGLNFSGLSASPLARNLIAQLGAKQGLTEADLRKIFDGLSGVDQIAVSVHDNRMVVMITGRVTDLGAPTLEAGMKAVPVSGNAMLVGHADAVDQAVQRIAMKGVPSEPMRLAEERQASSEFWATGSAGLVGQPAVSAGVKQFSLTVSFRDRLTSDLAFEFYGAPDAKTLEIWQTTLGATAVEANIVHVRTSMEAEEVQQKFGQIAAGPAGERLASLLAAARYLPVRDTTVQKQNRPIIYGLDGGPRVLNQGAK
jgi:hypothetical protein